ncbi:MAG: manganese efflux pump MntP family protein [Thermodesulfobacteriota bacterium]
MSLLAIIGLAVALAMDALAVSVAAGVCIQQVSARQFFRLSWHFGLFQAMMPVVGWCAGLSVRRWIEQYDHWLAFLLLAVVGAGMLRQAFGKEDEDEIKTDPTRGWRLVILSVATSIDALAVGLSLSLIGVSVWFPAVIIGLTAGLFTFSGMLLGSRAGRIAWLKRYAEIIGGLVLYAIGLRILYDHGELAAIIG